MDKLKQFAESKLELFTRATGGDAKAQKTEPKPTAEDGAKQPDLHAQAPESAPESSGAPFSDGRVDAPFDDSVMEDNLLWSAHYTYDEFVNALTVSYEDRGDSIQEKRHWSYPRRWRVKLENMHIINGTTDPLTCFAEFDFGGTRTECRVQLGTGTCILNKGETKNYIRTPIVPNVTKDVPRPVVCSHTFEYRGSYLDLEYEKLRIKLWRYRKYTINTLESIYEAPLLRFAKSDVKVEIPLYKTVKQQRILRCRITFDLYFEELYDFELLFLNWRTWDLKSSRDLLKEAKAAAASVSGSASIPGDSFGVKKTLGTPAAPINKGSRGGALDSFNRVLKGTGGAQTSSGAQPQAASPLTATPAASAHENPSLLQKIQYYFNRHKMEKDLGGGGYSGQPNQGGRRTRCGPAGKGGKRLWASQPDHLTRQGQGKQGVTPESVQIQGGSLKTSQTTNTCGVIKGSNPEPQRVQTTQAAPAVAVAPQPGHLKATANLPPCEYTAIIEQQMLAFKTATSNTAIGAKQYLPSPRLQICIKTDNGLTRKSALKLSSILQRNCKSCHWENVGVLVFRGTLMDLYKAHLEISIYDTGTLRAAVCVGQASIPLVGIVDYPHVRSVLSRPDWLALKANVEGWWPALQRWLFGHLSGSIVINRRPRYRQATTKLGLTLKSSPVMLVVTVVGVDQLLCDVLERVDTIDSYVQVSFNGLVHCTSFCRRSATPSWNEDVLIPFVLGDGETLGASNLLNRDPIYLSVWGHFSDGLDHQQTLYFGGACLYMYQLFYNAKGLLLPRVKKTLASASSSGGGSSLYDRMFDVRVFSGALKLEGLTKESQHQQSSLTVSAWIHPNVTDDKLPPTIDLTSGGLGVEDSVFGGSGAPNIRGGTIDGLRGSGAEPLISPTALAVNQGGSSGGGGSGALKSNFALGNQGSALHPSTPVKAPPQQSGLYKISTAVKTPSTAGTVAVTRFDTRRLLAPKMRQVYDYLCNDWRRVVSLKRPKHPELASAYLIDTQTHPQVYLSCLISPLYPPGDYETCNAIFHMIRCIPFVRKNTSVVYTPDFFMKLGCGGAIDHSILQVCYLRGLFPPVEAYVCLGTLRDKRQHAWVAVVDPGANVVCFYDSTSGSVWKLDNCVKPNSGGTCDDAGGTSAGSGLPFTSPEVSRESGGPSTDSCALGLRGGALDSSQAGDAAQTDGCALEVGATATTSATTTSVTAPTLGVPSHRRSLSKLPFDTIAIMFNERNVWLNVQQGSMDPRRCWYDVDDYRCWYAFSTRPHKVRECFVPRFPLERVTKYQLELMHTELHRHIERALTLYRSTHNLHTRWNRDERFGEFLRAGLLYINKRDVASDDNVEYISSRIRAWKRRLGSRVPPSHYLYAAPFFFNRCHPEAIADALVARVPLMDSREPCMTFAMSVLLSSVPGNFSSVYILVVVVYKISERTRRRLVSQQQRLALWRSKKGSKSAAPSGGNAVADLLGCRLDKSKLEDLTASATLEDSALPFAVSKVSGESGGAQTDSCALGLRGGALEETTATSSDYSQEGVTSSTDLDSSSATSDVDVDATPMGTPTAWYKAALKSSLELNHSKAKQLAQQTSRLKALQTRDLMNALDENLNLQDEHLTRMATRGVKHFVSIHKSGANIGPDAGGAGDEESSSSASDILKHLQSDGSIGDLASQYSPRVHFKDFSGSGSDLGDGSRLESDVGDLSSPSSLLGKTFRESGGALERNVALKTCKGSGGARKASAKASRDGSALTSDVSPTASLASELISPSLISKSSRGALGGSVASSESLGATENFAASETASLISESLGGSVVSSSWALDASSRLSRFSGGSLGGSAATSGRRVQGLPFTSSRVSRESGGASGVQGTALKSKGTLTATSVTSSEFSQSPQLTSRTATDSLLSGPVDYKPAIVSNMAKELLKRVEVDVTCGGGDRKGLGGVQGTALEVPKGFAGSGGVLKNLGGSGGALGGAGVQGTALEGRKQSSKSLVCSSAKSGVTQTSSALSSISTESATQSYASRISISPRGVSRSPAVPSSSLISSDVSSTIVSDPLGNWRMDSLKSLRALHTASINSESLAGHITARNSARGGKGALEALSRAVDVARNLKGAGDVAGVESAALETARESGGPSTDSCTLGLRGRALDSPLDGRRYVNELATLLQQQSGAQGLPPTTLPVPAEPLVFLQSYNGSNTATLQSQTSKGPLEVAAPPSVGSSSATLSSSTSFVTSAPLLAPRSSRSSLRSSKAPPYSTEDSTSSWSCSTFTTTESETKTKTKTSGSSSSSSSSGSVTSTNGNCKTGHPDGYKGILDGSQTSSHSCSAYGNIPSGSATLPHSDSLMSSLTVSSTLPLQQPSTPGPPAAATTTKMAVNNRLESSRSAASTCRSLPLPSVVEDFIESQSASSKKSQLTSTLSSTLESSATINRHPQGAQTSRKDTEPLLVPLQWNQSLLESPAASGSATRSKGLLESARQRNNDSDAIFRRRGRLETIGTSANPQSADGSLKVSKLSRQKTQAQEAEQLVSFDDLVTVRTASNVSGSTESLYTMLSNGNTTQVSDLESARMVAESLLDKVKQRDEKRLVVGKLVQEGRKDSDESLEKFNIFQSYL